MPQKRPVKHPQSQGEQVRQARRTLAVALAFARSKCLLDVLMEEIGNVNKEGIQLPSANDWRALRVNRATRCATLILTFYTLLQSVIDGWCRNHLSEPEVDILLSSDHVRVLGDFRNALMHPIGAAEERFTRMKEVHKDLAPWAFDLMKAFNTYFTSWFVAFDTSVLTGKRHSRPRRA
jgi:hypothetical protein